MEQYNKIRSICQYNFQLFPLQFPLNVAKVQKSALFSPLFTLVSPSQRRKTSTFTTVNQHLSSAVAISRPLGCFVSGFYFFGLYPDMTFHRAKPPTAPTTP